MKTLHGKRHIRACKSAEGGREKKIRKKLIRGVRLLGIVVPKITKSFEEAARDLGKMALAFQNMRHDKTNV